MKLKWKDCESRHLTSAQSETELAVASTDELVFEVFYRPDRDRGDAYLSDSNHGTIVSIPFRGDLSRGKALAESLAAWWQEQKPMANDTEAA
jgi:hypothetical protein